MLANKTILFIAPIFHGYESMIAKSLREKGANVLFHPERPYSIYFKCINNYFPSRLALLQECHYKSILKKIEGEKFDFLFVIRGYKISKSFLASFKIMNPEAKMIMYQWDSNRTNKFEEVIAEFDSVFSFDYEDCDQFTKLKYLPLFYADDINERKKEKITPKYDFFFMGTYIPERYDALLKFRDYIWQTNYSLKSYIYIPKTSLLKEKLRKKQLAKDIISTRHMSRIKYLEILSQSKVVVDVSNREQSGMAMRVVEALALNKKVITSNSNITKEPFFSERSILIYDVNKPDIPSQFVNGNCIQEASMLSINDWLKNIFNF